MLNARKSKTRKSETRKSEKTKSGKSKNSSLKKSKVVDNKKTSSSSSSSNKKSSSCNNYSLVGIHKSTKPDKKMMAIFKNNVNGREKTVHFGAAGYQDYTLFYASKGLVEAEKHKKAYIARHQAHENFLASGCMTAGALSRWILWNKTTVDASIKDYKNKFFSK